MVKHYIYLLEGWDSEPGNGIYGVEIGWIFNSLKYINYLINSFVKFCTFQEAFKYINILRRNFQSKSIMGRGVRIHFQFCGKGWGPNI